jgi:hypothetical protein
MNGVEVTGDLALDRLFSDIKDLAGATTKRNDPLVRIRLLTQRPHTKVEILRNGV